MGLLERALQYKQRINETGKETLIDRIKGPAETDYIKSINEKKIDISEIDQLTEQIIPSDYNQQNNEISTDKEFNILNEYNKQEEDIILLDERDYKDEEQIQKIFSESKQEVFSKKNPDISFDEVNEADASSLKEVKEEQEVHEVLNKQEVKDIKDEFKIKEEIEKDKVKITEQTSGINNSSILSNEIKEDPVTIKAQGSEKEEEDDATINNNFEMPEFNDFATLFEIQNEFIKANSIEDIYSTIIFSIMGQLAVSSVSIVAPSPEDEKKWIITVSHGIKISENDIHWTLSEGILQLLNTYQGVLDIEDIKRDSNLRDDYYKFIAVDARILAPLIKDGKLSGAILVGEKINSEDFTDEEIEFLHVLSNISSSIIDSLYNFEKISTEIIGLRIEKEILSDVEFFQDSLLNVGSLNELREVIQKNFYSLGLESYSLFMNDQVGGDFYPAYFESDDLLGFLNSGFKIKKDNRLITFLCNKKSSIILENFNESSVIIDTFGKNRITKMDIFVAYPFIISGQLLGFITIFKINPAVELLDIDIRIQKINRFLFPYLYRSEELDPDIHKYNDLTDSFYTKIEKEIQHVHEMNIPLSIISFTIKNYKRFFDRFGKIETEKLSENIAEIIKSKLSIGDFSARIDRNKILVVLPGKEKRYSVMFANTIKNEIIAKCSIGDFKLLLTSLISVFPEDGNDLFTILEVLE